MPMPLPPAPPGDEWLDRVDDSDVVQGAILRSEMMRTGTKNFRVVNGFIRNSAGQIWIPTRSASKRIFPLCLDCSIGGHVGSGEPYDLAFARETEEETGIKLAEVEWRCLGPLWPTQHPLSAFMQVYEIRSDAVPAYNPDDFISWEWLLPADLIAKIAAGVPAKGDLGYLVRHFYG